MYSYKYLLVFAILGTALFAENELATSNDCCTLPTPTKSTGISQTLPPSPCPTTTTLPVTNPNPFPMPTMPGASLDKSIFSPVLSKFGFINPGKLLSYFAFFEKAAQCAPGICGGANNSYAGPKPNRPLWKVTEKVIQYPINAAAWGGGTVTDRDRARKILKAICIVGNTVPAPYTNIGPCPADSDPTKRGAIACTQPSIVAGSLSFDLQGVVTYSNPPTNTKLKFPDGTQRNTSHNVDTASVYWKLPIIPANTYHMEVEIQVHIPSLTNADRAILNSIDGRLSMVADTQIASLLTHERVHVADFQAAFMEHQMLDATVLSKLMGREFTPANVGASFVAEIGDAFNEIKTRLDQKTARFHNLEMTPDRNQERGMGPIPISGFAGFQCDGADMAFMMP